MSGKKFILIMTDTQRTDMLGCYGNQDMKTPNMDAIAEQGIRFDKAYTCQPVCGPARSALFTGIYPHSNSSWGNSMPIGNNVKTIGQRLTDNGVHAGYIGKWHVDGGDYFGLGKCDAGWDEDYWYDMKNYLEELPEEDRLKSRQTSLNEEGVNEDFTFGHRCSNRAIDFIEKFKDEDFFLTVSYDEPHHPFICPEPYASMYKNYELPKRPNVYDTLEEKPDHIKTWAGDAVNKDREEIKVSHPYWFGCNSFVDYEIGRVMEAIDKYCPDALVIYTTDHGDALNSHCISNKGPAMYDEIARIPFLVKWKGVAPAGISNKAPASHIDIVPTILDYFNIPIPRILEGKSMLETIKDPKKSLNDEVFIEFSRYEIDHDGFGGFQPIRCIVDDKYKLVINLLTSDELYDMQEDPYEMKNLIKNEQYTEIRNALHDKLLDWMNETRDPFRGYYWERRPWRKDARPATWDYTGMTRQRENEEYEPRQLDYATGLEMEKAIRNK